MVLSQNRYSYVNKTKFVVQVDERETLVLYTLEQRIHTLAQNAIDAQTTGVTGFTAEGVRFSPWQNEPHEGWWTNPYWLATAKIEANDYGQAWNIFRERLARLVPRIALVSQCYTEYHGQPFLIRRTNPDVAFIRWTKERGATGLMFMADELLAFNALFANSQIPDEFFWYWSDATNATGYSSKLLLMLSAVEALVKVRKGKRKGQKSFAKLERILGRKLKVALWGKPGPGNSTKALRHRLVHGEYFESKDAQTDYFTILHQKVIKYFNRLIFHHEWINESVVSPQRHPTENREQASLVLRARGNANLSLIDVCRDLERNGIDSPENYEHVNDDAIRNNL